MRSGSSIHRGFMQAALALCATLTVACGSGTKSNGGQTTGGADSGPAWLHICGSVGATCTADGDCCSNITCQNGACATPSPACAGYAEPCGTGQPACCQTTGAADLLTCTAIASAGISVCVPAQSGSSCSGDSDCPSPYWCVQGTCNLAQNKADCNTKDAGSCVEGDLCISNTPEYNKILGGGYTADPCLKSGLVCVFFNSLGAGLCVPPGVETPLGWSPSGDPFDPGICNPANDKCGAYYTGAEHTPPICAGFVGEAAPHCVPSCTTGDDCDSVTEDCIGGACLPQYCYADGQYSASSTYAQYYTKIQQKAGGIAVSSDPKALFALCPEDAGVPMVCLPEYQDLEPSAQTIGECVRVGGPESGGWGAPCDPNAYRNNLGGLCQFGTFCYLGTCMPWCDIGSNDNVQCPSGTVCQPMATGPLNSTATGSTHAMGVCATACNPYLHDDENPCQPLASDAGQPDFGCKYSGNGSDTSPPPGNCAALPHDPVAVGQPCTPFGWIDPCVSGAECLQLADGGGGPFTCRQLCNPESSSNADPSPACPQGQTCNEFSQCPSYICTHMGDCE